MLRFASVLALASLAAPAPAPILGTGTIYLGGYSGRIVAVDEATAKVIAQIPLATGAPWAMRLSSDHTRFYVQSADQQHFEVVDIASRRSLDHFTLSEGRSIVRPLAYDVDPSHRTMALVTRTVTKRVDRFEIGEPELLLYDLTAHAVTRRVPWTAAEEPRYYAVTMRYSPDGRWLYVFGDEVTVYDAATLQVVDTWDFALPTSLDVGRYTPGSWDESTDPSGTFTGLFTTSDPVTHRKQLVVGRVDLGARTIDAFTLGPVPPTGYLNFALAPDRSTAYILREEIGQHELWTIDMAARKVVRRVPFKNRPRLAVQSSSNGTMLYLYEAGHTIEIHRPDTLEKLQTIALDTDMMYGTFFVLPGPAPPSRR